MIFRQYKIYKTKKKVLFKVIINSTESMEVNDKITVDHWRVGDNNTGNTLKLSSSIKVYVDYI